MTTAKIVVIVCIISGLTAAGCGSVSPNEPVPDAYVWHDAAPPECEQGQTTCVENNFHYCLLGEWNLSQICGEIVCDPHDGCPGNPPPPDGLSFIWVANTGESTLSKIDTREEVEVARYLTCPDGYCDPSRTSVNRYGDAVVTNRDAFPSSLTKFAANPDDCVDRNSNGTIETSTGPTDVLAWGSDECMIWHSVLPVSTGQDTHGARATAWDGQEDQYTGEGGHVWVGTCNWGMGNNVVYKVNGDTGEIDDHVVIPDLGCSYGGAVDGVGNLWIIDPWGSMGGAISLWQIEMDGMWPTQRTVSCGYGITVDSQNRVWSGGGTYPCASRYDPVADVEDIANFPTGMFPRGIAAGVGKSAGYVWQVDDGMLFKINEETLVTEASYPISGMDTIGVAVDYEGYVWVVAQGSSQVFKFDPDTETYITMAVGMGPYTYSDMTGVQLRNVVPVD